MRTQLRPETASINYSNRTVQTHNQALRQYQESSPYFKEATAHFGVHPGEAYEIFFPSYCMPHLAITQCIGNLEAKRILEVGCVWGPYLDLLRSCYKVKEHGLDVNDIAVEFAREKGGLNVACGNVLTSDLPNGEFDVVLSHHFLDMPYIGNTQRGIHARDFISRSLQIFHWALKPGGMYFSSNENFDRRILEESGFSRWINISFSEFDRERPLVMALEK